jgi:hypothetical protein
MEQNSDTSRSKLPRVSVDESIIATGGRASGSDYLRIILDYLVVLSHSHVVTYKRIAVRPAMGSEPMASRLLTCWHMAGTRSRLGAKYPKTQCIFTCRVFRQSRVPCIELGD